MTQHRTNLSFEIDAPPYDHTIIMRTTSPSSPTSTTTSFFGRRLRLDSFDSINTVSSEFSLPSSSSSSSSSLSSSFSLKPRKSTKQPNHHHHHRHHNHHHHHHHHHNHNRNDFLFCGPNENGGFLATITTPKQQQQSTDMDLPQHSSGRPIIEFTFAKDENNNDDVIPERLLVPVL
jgi:hypothetical protein